jgi:hypothetical protein
MQSIVARCHAILGEDTKFYNLAGIVSDIQDRFRTRLPEKYVLTSTTIFTEPQFHQCFTSGSNPEPVPSFPLQRQELEQLANVLTDDDWKRIIAEHDLRTKIARSNRHTWKILVHHADGNASWFTIHNREELKCTLSPFWAMAILRDSDAIRIGRCKLHTLDEVIDQLWPFQMRRPVPYGFSTAYLTEWPSEETGADPEKREWQIDLVPGFTPLD